MPASRYLPSAQFVVIVASIALSGGLVLAAQYVTNDTPSSAHITASNQIDSLGTADWRTTLYEIQGASALQTGTEGREGVQASLDVLFEAAKTPNITENIGRSLLLSLSEAKSQGMGSDIPTQERLIAEAAKQLDTNTAPLYKASDLTIVTDTPAALREYGNAAAGVIAQHPKASARDTYLAIGYAVDNNDATQLETLATIGKEYEAIAKDLLAVVVPQTLYPFHLQIINNFSRAAGSYADMQAILADPLRGFGGLQFYNDLTGEISRLFTNIAQTFSKNGILFTKDEPGIAWSSFLSQ